MRQDSDPIDALLIHIVKPDDQFYRFLNSKIGPGQSPCRTIGGEIARSLGFRVPESVFCALDSSFGRIEGDEPISIFLVNGGERHNNLI